MKKIHLHSFDTELGVLHTAVTENGLVLVGLPNESKRHFKELVLGRFKDREISAASPVNRKAESEIRQYLSGKRKEFTVPLDLQGSPFYKRSLEKVALIPFGKVRTYGQVAKSLGNPNASRAVGSANARNPLPLFIPCHRVVASNGLGGYGGGLAMKKKLLVLEGVDLTDLS